MGTPEFAVESLKQLIENNYEIAAVVTAPDKPAGRGLKIKESAVKIFAMNKGLPILQPQSLKQSEFLAELKSLNANLFVVVAFRILPEEVWLMPEFGTFNLHASLLPNYRGAAPINHAIMNGESVTGVTTFFLNSGIDTGKIILQKSVGIGPDQTAGELHDQLMVIGAKLLIETVDIIKEGNLRVAEQSDIKENIKLAPRIYRQDCKIDWSKSTREVHNFIRGLSPYPGAHSKLTAGENITEVKILHSALFHSNEKLLPGEVIIKDRKRLLVFCSDDFIEVKQLQATGKKAMRTEDFLRGIKSEFLHFEIY
jgi:methionyl-tRNA formyltransferase